MPSLPVVPNKYVKTVSDSVVVCGHTIGAQERIIKGLDDKVYEAHRDIWELVPRGHGVYTFDGSKEPVALIAGLRKFGYEGTPYGNRAAVTHAFFIEKENGECAHVTGFRADGARWWIAGSKHVHIAFPEGCDFAEVAAAYTADRYKYAIKIARVWHRMLSGLAHKETLHNHVCDTFLTLCGEAILADSEHIVAYDTKDIIKFYAVTDARPSSAGLTALDPMRAMELFRSCGLPCATMSSLYSIGSDDYKAALDAVARRNNSEGVVVYGMRDGVVCAMWKEKSYPYVMERVVREAIIHGKTVHAIKRRVGIRLADHDASLRAYFAEWEASRFPWLLRFAVWLRLVGLIPAKSSWDIQSRWLTLQAEFRGVERDADMIALIESKLAAADSGTGPIVIMFVGLPGSGKSTAARGLYWILKQAGAKPRWLNQDEADSNRYKYLEAIKAAVGDPETTHILLDKSNLAEENRADYAKLGLTPTLTVMFEHSEGVEAYKAECAARFLARGAAHRSLRASGEDAVDATKFNAICDSMLSKFSDLEESEKVLVLDVRSWPDVNLSAIMVRLDVDGDMAAAVDFSKRYEAALAASPKKRVTYGGIHIQEGMDTLLALIPAEALESKTLKREFHITTHFLGDEMDPIWYLEQLDRIKTDAIVALRVTELVWDTHCVTARVERIFDCAPVSSDSGEWCQNANPHITLALDAKTKPVYSNSLLCNSAAATLTVDCVVRGKYFM